MINFFLRPARELIFSLKYSCLNVLTGKNHPCSGKILYVEKKDLKVTKNRFFGIGILRTFRKSHFSIKNTEIKYKSLHCQKLHQKSRVMMCSVCIYNDYDRHNSLLSFKQKLHLFPDIYFSMDIMIDIVREDNITTYFESTWSRAMNRIADTSTERSCQSEW